MKSRAIFFALVCCLVLPRASAQVPTLDALKFEAVRSVDSRKDFSQVMVDSIFSFSELGFQEMQTSKFVTEILEKEGFQVLRGVVGMPAAWVASWGNGKPVIGLSRRRFCGQCPDRQNGRSIWPVVVRLSTEAGWSGV